MEKSFEIADLVWCHPLNERATIGIVTRINKIGISSYEIYEVVTNNLYGWTPSASINKLNK
jgi:hypothetical protein